MSRRSASKGIKSNSVPNDVNAININVKPKTEYEFEAWAIGHKGFTREIKIVGSKNAKFSTSENQKSIRAVVL